MLREDMEIISAVFAGSVIREGFGKICAASEVSLYINQVH
jgi:hypothetical protein